MYKTKLLLAFLCVAGFMAACAPPLGMSDDAADKAVGASSSILPAPVKVLVKTDKDVYRPGETVVMTLTATNVSNRPVRLTFPTSQRYDFVVSCNGMKLWQWSEGKVFLQVIGTIVLWPRQSLTYRTAEYRIKLPPMVGIIGREYTFDLEGILTSTPQITGQTRFIVSPETW